MPERIRDEDDELPEGLRPFKYHGIDVTSYRKGVKNVITDCPFCGAEGKFSIEVSTTKWRCFKCNEGFDKKGQNGSVKSIRGGNALELLQLLWKYSDTATTEADYAQLAKDRGFLSPAIFVRWEVVKSITTGEWLVPAYTISGHMVQLYKYVKLRLKDKETGGWITKYQLRPTPSMGEEGHRTGIFGMGGFDKKRPIIDVFEAWNGMAYEEVISQIMVDPESGEWKVAGSFQESVGAERNVIAFPGCAGFDEWWVPLFKGKVTNFWFDNDHPKLNERTQTWTEGAGGLYGARNAEMLKGVATEVNRIQWGEGDENFGWYAPELPSGYDVRDVLRPLATLEERSEALYGVFTALASGAVRTHEGAMQNSAGEGGKLRPLPCSYWKDLVLAWRKAFRWRQELEDALSICLAICLSTEQIGDQLFMMLIADAGSGKSAFADAMLTSDKTYAVENVNGLFSGMQGGACSPIQRMNRKTWITAEGDTVVNHPAFMQFLAQVRRAFDGKGSADYKNTTEAQVWEGLRAPWILCGTPKMMDTLMDQASLGDRFLKFFIRQPDDDEKKAITRRAGFSAAEAVRKKSGHAPEEQMEESLGEATRMTGGYVDWLRDNTHLLEEVVIEDETIDRCAVLGEFAAALRARPGKSKSDEAHDAKEMPTRLTKQFVRSAMCLAVVVNKTEVDEEVMRVIRMLAWCTSSGLTMQIAKELYKNRKEGTYSETIGHVIGKTHDRAKELLRFMAKIKAVYAKKPVDPETQKLLKERWWLSEHMTELWEDVVLNWGKDV